MVSLIYRSWLNEFNDDIFVYIKDRYFIDEMVEVMFGNERYESERDNFFIVI